MAKKQQGLQVSITAGVVVVAALALALVLQMLEPASSTDTDSETHATTAATDPHEPQTSHDTYVMPDGSTMSAEEMSAHDAGAVGGVEGADAGHDATPEESAAAEESGHASTSGAIDWQVITLIIGLIAACIAVATAINEYLRRRTAAGAYAAAEAKDG